MNLKSVQDAKVDIVGAASEDRSRERPVAVTCAIQADKYFKRRGETLLDADDGMYTDEPLSEETWKKLRAALVENFSIEKLKRMQEIILSLRKAGNPNFQIKR